MTTTSEPFAPTRIPDQRLPASLELGAVGLNVRDAAHSAAFYGELLGLEARHEADGDIRLVSADTAADERHVLTLHEDPEAAPASRRAGIYHVALLYPSRATLANVLQRIALSRTPIQGASDHGTHEAIYLADPDGIGLELAADRPRDKWKPYDLDGTGPRPLDVDGLLAAASEGAGSGAAIAGVGVGHLHLHVNDLTAAESFWVDVVGFDRMFGFETACFVAAGGYHHHLGFNTWRGEGIPPADPTSIGMRWWSIRLPAADATRLRARLDAAGHRPHPLSDDAFEVRDPAGMRLRVHPL